jgi:hypothetical protein
MKTFILGLLMSAFLASGSFAQASSNDNISALLGQQSSAKGASLRCNELGRARTELSVNSPREDHSERRSVRRGSAHTLN